MRELLCQFPETPRVGSDGGIRDHVRSEYQIHATCNANVTYASYSTISSTVHKLEFITISSTVFNC